MKYLVWRRFIHTLTIILFFVTDFLSSATTNLMLYTVCFFFIITKVFVHLTNLKLFYRGLKYLNILVCLFHFIKKCQKYTFKFFKVISLNFSKIDVFDIFTLNAVSMTSTYNVILHNLMSFYYKPKLKTDQIHIINEWVDDYCTVGNRWNTMIPITEVVIQKLSVYLIKVNLIVLFIISGAFQLDI